LKSEYRGAFIEALMAPKDGGAQLPTIVSLTAPAHLPVKPAIGKVDCPNQRFYVSDFMLK